jgi:YD repeat-containing protein
VSLDARCLLVAVDDPGWATRFRYEQAGLIEHFARELGEGVVTRIDVRVRPPNSGENPAR